MDEKPLIYQLRELLEFILNSDEIDRKYLLVVKIA
jgi:hypothetical protein